MFSSEKLLILSLPSSLSSGFMFSVSFSKYKIHGKGWWHRVCCVVRDREMMEKKKKAIGQLLYVLLLDGCLLGQKNFNFMIIASRWFSHYTSFLCFGWNIKNSFCAFVSIFIYASLSLFVVFVLLLTPLTWKGWWILKILAFYFNFSFSSFLDSRVAFAKAQNNEKALNEWKARERKELNEKDS